MELKSYWQDSASVPRFARLDGDLAVDVVVVGAGLTGVTAAYLLKKAGCQVALLERGHCGGVDTSHTTAHVTAVTDLRLHQLVRRFGKEQAGAVWAGGFAAMDRIIANIEAEGIACEFLRVPGYLYAAGGAEQADARPSLERDAKLARELGFAAEFLEQTPALGAPGVRFAHQAKFHPLKYLHGLLRTIPGGGSYVFEHTEATEFSGKPLLVKAGEHQISCRFCVLATHTPLMGRANMAAATLLQSKLYLYTSYALGARLPSNSVPEALYWDTAEPYSYLRVDHQQDFDYAIFGGEDHKTGQEKRTEAAYARLEQKFQHLLSAVAVDHRWSGQVVETNDGLPFIGETAPGQFIATGFAGNGMTFGTLSAMMAVDAFLGRSNPWAAIFSPKRKKLFGGTWRYVKENKDYPYYLVHDRVAGAEGKSPMAVRKGEGKILNLDGKKVAAYRDDDGQVTLCSAICTHLKCIVKWNPAEQTWDCPCHGSRFMPTGEVLSGPAEEDLERVTVNGKAETSGKHSVKKE